MTGSCLGKGHGNTREEDDDDLAVRFTCFLLDFYIPGNTSLNNGH